MHTTRGAVLLEKVLTFTSGHLKFFPKGSSKDVTQATELISKLYRKASFSLGSYISSKALSTRRCIAPETKQVLVKKKTLYKYLADVGEPVNIAWLWDMKRIPFRNRAYAGAPRNMVCRLQSFQSLWHFVDGVSFSGLWICHTPSSFSGTYIFRRKCRSPPHPTLRVLCVIGLNATG